MSPDAGPSADPAASAPPLFAAGGATALVTGGLQPEPLPARRVAAPREPIRPLLSLATSAALRFFFVGSGLGTMLFLLTLQEELPQFVAHNTIYRETRNWLLLVTAGSGVLALLLAGVAWLVAPRPQTVVRLERLARLASPLMLSFPLPLFFNWRIFQGRDLLFVISATLWGLGLERTLRTLFAALPETALTSLSWRLSVLFPRAWRHGPTTLAVLMALSFSVYFSYYSILEHWRLATQSFDMAIFDNIFWNLLRGEWFKATPVLGPTGSHIQQHATFIAYVLLPIYALAQRPETLLIIQATLCGLAVLPIFLLVRRRLSSAWAALAMAYVYAVHGGLHGPIFYDFHFVTSAAFWVTWVLYCFEAGKKKLLVLCWILAILVREEVSASLSAAALLYLLSGKRPRWAFIGGAISIVYFVVIKFFVMPAHHSGGSHSQSFAWIFQGLIPAGEGGFTGVVRTLASNPVFTLNSLLETDKLVYALRMLGPVLLLPLRHRLTWILVLPAAMFTLLSTGYKPLIEASFQYTANYTSYIFFASAVAISAWKERTATRPYVPAALCALLLTSTVFSYNQGAIFQHNNFRGGFHQVAFKLTPQDKERKRQLYELIAMVPPRASIVATESEAPHVSARPECFTMRIGHFNAEYILVNLDEVSFGDSRTHLRSALDTGKYGFVASRGRFALWSRHAGHEKDAEGRRLLGLR